MTGSFHFLSSLPTEDGGLHSETENINCVFVPGAGPMFVAWIELFTWSFVLSPGEPWREAVLFIVLVLWAEGTMDLGHHFAPLALRSQKPLV